MTTEAVAAVPRSRSIAVEVDYTTQMLMPWTDLLARAQEVAEAQGAPTDINPVVVRVATPGQPGLLIWRFTDG